MYKRFILIFISLFFIIVSNAQFSAKIKKTLDSLNNNSAVIKAKDILKKVSPDTNYVYEYANIYSINPSLLYRTNFIEARDKNGGGQTISYRPNSPTRFGILGSYKGVRLGFTFKIPTYLKSSEESKSFGIYLGTQTHFLNWGFDAYYLKNQGYYLANSANLIPNWPVQNGLLYRSDISTVDVGITTHAVFSNKISLKAATNQSERQLRSAGGVALQIGVGYGELKSDSTMIPFSQKNYYEDVATLKKASYISLNAMPGYVYTFVRNDFYSTSMLNFGVDLQLQFYKFDESDKSHLRFSPAYKFRQIFGYNTKKGFFKVEIIYDVSNLNLKQTQFRYSFLAGSVGGGIRFDKI